MPTALIIGASRGLGLGLAQEYRKRGWDVIGTVRGAGTGLHALAASAPGHVRIEPLEVTDDAAIAALRARLAGQVIDLLFINAGISDGGTDRVATTSTARFTEVMLTNALAPLRCLEALHDLVPAGGTIALMSSGLGSVADNAAGGWEVYRASKAALNTLVRSFAARHPNDRRSMVLVAPGWVRTDMGGPQATLGIEESIPAVVDTLAAQNGQPGLRYLDYQGKSLRW
jgi:NAD(P)-dependent dehydrogenase (short-subunit alcohol dehydrogenase family)